MGLWLPFRRLADGDVRRPRDLVLQTQWLALGRLTVAYNNETAHGAITVYIDGELANTITGTASSPILTGAAVRDAQEQFMIGAAVPNDRLPFFRPTGCGNFSDILHVRFDDFSFR